ncbi:putative receptor protein kinase ZmPK1 [Trifolium pratense]|uniref:putative receptor protein kinase ZmPK1 n=1 Tax=Trifolium pratense TaxID=57577 RepID=UPI001E696308|nr:putative receptor protein kinase ZmPK1 [Trifolium pratense]
MNNNMDFSFTLFLLVSLAFSFQCSSSSSSSSLRKGSSLSVENPEDKLISHNGMFSAGFISIGQNAYSFAIWFTEPNSLNHKNTIVWMANRDQPVNGKRSKLTLLNTGNIVLLDVSLNNVWSSKTASLEPLELHLKNDGNLVLLELQGTKILWQSFDSPTDTLVPGQPLTRYTKLVASRSDTNHSSGFYQFFFDDENILGLHYNGRDVSSSYWPKPWLLSWDVGRSNFNSSRIAVLGSFGEFYSSDNFTFTTSDYGSVMQRIMKLDSDGVVRVYSRINVSQNWYVSWQAFSGTCTVHGVCGANSTCSYSPKLGRKCSCIPGYRMKNPNDWSYGCEPMFDFTCNKSESTFLEMKNVEFYGYDFHYIEICNFSTCVDLCLQDCNCKAFQFSYWEKHGFYRCFTKTQLQNGRYYPIFKGSTYLRLPKGNTFSLKQTSNPSNNDVCSEKLQRVYVNEGENHFVKFFLWFATAIGAFQTVCIFVIWCSLFRSNQKTYADQEGYHIADIGFRKFSYLELKKATKGFSQEIGRGGGGVVYKGLLSDERHAAIKRLYNAQQGGEGEFLAEVGIIGRLNHMNLIEMWGYCAEGKYRLLVYEYMENGSLADNLSSNKLDWSKRYKIALAIARVLAYLHEECLEWILHCDIKPQNILLDSNFQPKLADFGLSKLQNRNNLNNSSVSMIRGTRGYMAPEWIFNLPITSKVDVYSYGIVVLEMITGKSPTTGFKIVNAEEESVGRLVTWVREKRGSSISWLEEIVDPNIGLNYDKSKMEILAKVALDCVVDERDSRPTMSRVVEMLQYHGND